MELPAAEAREEYDNQLMTVRLGDFKFKFYSPKDKEYIGAYNHQMNTINDLSFTQFYWGNNELGPETYDFVGRNLLYTIPAAKATGKVRINLWKVGKDSITATLHKRLTKAVLF